MIASSHEVTFHAVGARPDQVAGTLFESIPWTEESECELLAGMDIGIMPLTDGPWERGKCGYKLVQYMAAGLPVVASPVGANAQIVIQGKTGFLADSATAWAESLEVLISNSDLRRAFGAAGRLRAVSIYSLNAQLPRITSILHRAARKGIQ
tara:strand:- start:62 stop:517 length:456 start_codon:yes stop_codon:yes gene_type:complete